jgi:hypothetical protein
MGRGAGNTLSSRFMKSSQLIVWGIIIAFAGWWGFSKVTDHAREKVQEQKRVQQSTEDEAVMTAEAAKYNAVTGWDDTVNDAKFSLQIEDAVIPANNRPILIKDGMLTDVDHKGGDYFVHISSLMTTTADIEFILKTDEATARRFMSQHDSMAPLNVIAHISSVEQAEIALKSGPKTTEDDAPVQTDAPSQILARGELLELVPEK